MNIRVADSAIVDINFDVKVSDQSSVDVNWLKILATFANSPGYLFVLVGLCFGDRHIFPVV